jgi:hypothetical protein
LACHSIQFSRFKLRQIHLLTCGFVRRVPLDLLSAARRYITHSSYLCQHRFESFFCDPRGSLFRSGPGQQKRPSTDREAHSILAFVAYTTTALQLWTRLPALDYQLALRFIRLRWCGRHTLAPCGSLGKMILVYFAIISAPVTRHFPEQRYPYRRATGRA